MTALHWERKFLISESQVKLIKSELTNIKRNVIITPDTDASFKNIFEILDRLKGD